jgi:dihydrofolate reductase
MQAAMRRLTVFNAMSLDGCIADARGDMSWAHFAEKDPEWTAFVAGNAKGGGELLFGRVTYDMMVSYWTSPQAAKNDAVVAERMNALPKVVFSRTMDKASWGNTRLVKGDLPGEVRRLKGEAGKDMVILGSASIVAQLAQENLVDEYQVVVIPVVLGGGKSMFAGVSGRPALKLVDSRVFRNGNVLLRYGPAA